jgi:hypothetical protein
MITSTSDGKALRMRGFLVLRALPQQSAQRPPRDNFAHRYSPIEL